MKLKAHISKTANLFFFISNLSNWSPYTRIEYNNLWLKRDPLSREEREALSKIRIALRKKNIDHFILSSRTDKEAIGNITKTLSKKDKKNILRAFDIFMPRFEKIWRKEKLNLNKISLILRELPKNAKDTLLVSMKLYGSHKLPVTTKIFLFTSPITKRIVSGGQGLGGGKITLECSRITKKNDNKQSLLRVVLHEIIHSSLEENVRKKIRRYVKSIQFSKRYRKFILKSKIYSQTKDIEGVIKEMVAVSFIPEGYLAEKFFGLDVFKNMRKRECIKYCKLEKNYYDLMLFSVWKLYDTAKEYCEGNKTINTKYLEKTMSVWECFEKNDLRKLQI